MKYKMQIELCKEQLAIEQQQRWYISSSGRSCMIGSVDFFGIYFLRATKLSAFNFEKFLWLKYCTYMK